MLGRNGPVGWNGLNLNFLTFPPDIFLRGGHAPVLLPPPLLLEEDDLERGVPPRGEQLSRGQDVRPRRQQVPEALREEGGLQVSGESCSLCRELGTCCC